MVGQPGVDDRQPTYALCRAPDTGSPERGQRFIDALTAPGDAGYATAQVDNRRTDNL